MQEMQEQFSAKRKCPKKRQPARLGISVRMKGIGLADLHHNGVCCEQRQCINWDGYHLNGWGLGGGGFQVIGKAGTDNAFIYIS
jgi:hypothetical protein